MKSITGYIRRFKIPKKDRGWGCGYVIVPPDFDENQVDVHGGITWAKDHLPNGTSVAPNKVIGFDTAHCDDNPFEHHRSYVLKQTQSLARQVGLLLNEKSFIINIQEIWNPSTIVNPTIGPTLTTPMATPA